MIVELSNGTEVQFVSSGRGLEGAAYNFNSGPDASTHLHVYLSVKAKFMCSGKRLSKAEIQEAEALYDTAVEQRETEDQGMRDVLLGRGGEELIAERQQNGRLNDKHTASSDICRALGLWKPYKQNPSWAEVKARLVELRQGQREFQEAQHKHCLRLSGVEK